MNSTLCFIGFGEAGAEIATSLGKSDLSSTSMQAYDIKLAKPTTAPAMLARIKAMGVTPKNTVADALGGAHAVISVVTADQAHMAALAAAEHIEPGTLFLDMNSCAPGTKRQSAAVIAEAGGIYVDVAVMAPITTAGHRTAMLAATSYGRDAEALFAALDMKVRMVGDTPGRASTIKMLRSVMIKGIEALTAECFQAACRAGVADDVAASMDASEPTDGWAIRASYNMERMTTHGIRRAAEMREVVKTLAELGVASPMTDGTVTRQDAFGALGIDLTETDGLAARMTEIETAMGDDPSAH